MAKKEHGIVYPSNMVHISTIPLKLAKVKKKEGKVADCIADVTKKGTADDPGAVCAAQHDKSTGTTKWRGKKEEGGPGSGRTSGGGSSEPRRVGQPGSIGRAPSMRTPAADHTKGLNSIGQHVQVTKGTHTGGKGKVLDYNTSTGHATVSFGNQNRQIPIGQLKTISKSDFHKNDESNKEGGEGSGRHRGARIYQDGKSYRALTPSGHNIGPYKDAGKLKSHLDDYEKDFKLEPKPKEAVSATSQVAQLRDKTKESFKFKESNNSPFKNHSFQVILIEEGLGNFKDRFFYTKESLQTAAQSKLFEGVQCFADHPTEIEEQIQPERSTRDILGYYEGVTYEESDDGTGRLIANLCVGNAISLDWAMSLLTNSIDYSAKFKETDLIGLSINASGSAEPIELDAFLSSNELSPTILNKLNEAKAQGVTDINVVNTLTQAISVDLVTKAGAGGKILRMLEMEKNMGKKKSKFFESEMEKHNEDGSKDATAMAPGSAGTPDHSDEDQDKALFAKMIKQYLGKDDADQEEMEMAKHAYQAHKEMGMEGHEAYEAAGHHLKMAMAIGKKMAQAEGHHEAEGEAEGEAHHENEGEAEHEETQSPPPAPKAAGKGTPSPTGEGKKESMVIELSGEVAKLRESLKAYELRDHLDKKLRESGRSNTFTKKFREALGSPRSVAHIDQMWKIFLKAADAGVEEVGTESDVFVTEKTTYRESGSSSRGLDLSDCLR